jgi:DNA-binding XRE family transcriptional regulator
VTDTISRMKSPEEHEEYGRALIVGAKLAPLRQVLGLTRTAMAEMLRVAPITYYRCEDDPSLGGRIWGTTAQRVGRLAWLAQVTLDQLDDLGIEIRKLTPFHRLAQTTGWPQEVLLKWYRAGMIEAEDLGILGLWVHDDDLHLIAEAH